MSDDETPDELGEVADAEDVDIPAYELPEGLFWLPSSAEGLTSKGEQINQFGRLTALLKTAFETQSEEAHDYAIEVIHQAYAFALDHPPTTE